MSHPDTKRFGVALKNEPITSSIPNIVECPWFKSINIAELNTPPDTPLTKLREGLMPRFSGQNHRIIQNPQASHSDERINLMLFYGDIKDGPDSLINRIEERNPPLGLSVMNEFQLKRRPDNLVSLVTIPEQLSSKSHRYVGELARTYMARTGVPRVVFVTGDKNESNIFEVTYCTLEGGHSTITADNFDNAVAHLANKLVTAGCSEEVGHRYKKSGIEIAPDVFNSSPGPDSLIVGMRRANELNLLPEPLLVANYVNKDLAKIYQRFLNMQQFSEGMAAIRDPILRAILMTASGSFGVDKRGLTYNEIVAATGVDENGDLLISGSLGPSVEGFEAYYAFMHSLELRALFHGHAGIDDVDEKFVEVVKQNRKKFPYPSSCGMLLNLLIALDVIDRSVIIADDDDPRDVLLYELDDHGFMAFEVEKPSNRGRVPLQSLFDKFDKKSKRPGAGAITYNASHITQTRL